MFWFDKIFDWFTFGSQADFSSEGVPDVQEVTCTINPATSLPMVSGSGAAISGSGGVDVAGNPYGMYLQDRWTHSDRWDSSSSCSSSWDSSIGSSWDD